MNNVPPSLSRRTGLVAAASLAFGAAGTARGGTAETQSVPPPPGNGTGKGPPTTESRGMGMQIRLVVEHSYEFTNVVLGTQEQPQAWWVFAVGSVTVDHYIKVLTGRPGKILVFDVVAPVVCRAYRVESGFTLGLTWAIDNNPNFYTRPFVKGEY